MTGHLTASLGKRPKNARSKPKKREPPPRMPRVPHVKRLMALAIRLEDLLDSGLVGSQTEIAQAAGITKARVTQIINLSNLAPDIQQAILELEPTAAARDPFLERDARTIARHNNWSRQRKEFKKLTSNRAARNR